MNTTPDPMRPFAVSQFTTWHQTFEQDVELYARLGIPGIEVCERKLSDDPGRARDQLALVAEHGLTVTSVQPRCHALFPDGMAPEPTDTAARFDWYCQTIDRFAEAFPGQDLPLVTITGPAPKTNFHRAWQTARDHYTRLADYAAERGLRIMLEPLSPILMNIDTFIGCLDDALRLIGDVGRANFGLMLDVWHVWSEPGIVQRIAALDGKRVFGVHVCDWPAGEPRHIADRVLPGDGVIPMPAMLGAIHDSGYRGAYCLEIFSHDDLPGSLWQQPPADVLTRAQAAHTRQWQQVEQATCG